MRIFAAATMIILLTEPVLAQQGVGINLWNDKPVTSEEMEKSKAIDNEYKSTIKNLPDRKSGSDPWGSVRGSSTSQNSQNKSRSGTR